MSFYVTLTNNNLNENNTISDFITILDESIILDSSYEVALVEFTYCSSIIYDLGTIKVEYDPSTQANKDLPLVWAERNVRLYDRSNMYEFISACRGWPLRGLNMSYDNNFRQLTIALINPGKTVILSPQLLTFLNKKSGFSTGVLQMKPIVEITKTLFLYCDIIEDQLIGNKKEKILKIVKLEGDKEEIVYKEYEKPHYLNVDKTLIQNITINIRGLNKQLLHFKSGPILIKLHFRKKHGLLRNATKRCLNGYFRK